MRRAALRLAVLGALLPAPADAGGTSVSMTFVVAPAVCARLDSSCQNGKPVSCDSDDDCTAGSVDPRSKFSFGGRKGIVKASFRGVTDAAGALVTTDGLEGTADDYVLIVRFTDCYYDDFVLCDQSTLDRGVALKVELTNGKGKLKVDLGPVLANYLGERSLRVRGAELRMPPTNPLATCPGDNSEMALTMRSYDGCVSEAMIGMAGILNGS
jgi:hypothetical protein